MITSRYHVALAVVMVLILASAGAPAQIPANDSCAGAVTIASLPFTYSQNSRLATADPTDPILACADSGGGKTVWFTYTPGATQYVRFSTVGSTPADYDVALGLFTGSCGSLVEVSCADDSIPGTIRAATLGYEVQSGVTYYLHVAEWKGGGPSGYVPTGGDLVLNVYLSTPTPLSAGPKSGSVAGGDSIVLSVLGGKNIPSGVGLEPGSAAHNPPQVLLPAPADVRPPKGPAGSNFTKDPSVSALAVSTAQPVVLKNFQGNTSTGFIPPDPIVAAGPDHVIGMVNSSFTVWDKDGALLETRSAGSWFSNVASPVGFSDPQILYDHFTDRWIMAGGNFSAPYGFLISVSDDSDPLGTWYNWSLPSGLGDSLTGNLPDYPQIGYDSLAIYITTREFNPGFLYSRVRIIEKTQLYNNDAGPVTWTDFWDLREPDHPSAKLDGIRPSIIYGSPGEHYMVNASPYNPGTFFTLWKILDPVGTPSITGENISVVEYASPGNASQLGGGTALESGGGAIRHKAVYRDSSLWMVHSIASGPGNAYASVRYVRINPHTATNLEDEAMGADGYWHYYPALMADGDRNIVVTYTRSGLTEYPGAFVAGHKDTDPPGLSPSIPVAEGVGNYDVVGGGRNRWGDYMGIALDPVDPHAVWVNTEYAVATNDWETRVAMVKMGPLPGAYINASLSSMAFGSVEVTDSSDSLFFTLTNNGIDTLEVASIDIPDSHFILVNPPSYPLKIATFGVDTLWVRFAPEARGSFADSIVVNSSDTVRPALKISVYGSGFIVDPAASGTMYSSSGVTDFGRLRTVNPIDASTSTVGPSGFNQLINIRVNPATGELMGLATNSATTAAEYDLVRVNSSLADAHSIAKIPLNFLKGMTYRDDTLYVGRITGGIYSVDPVTGTPTLVAASGKQIAGLDFNPVTGELWASVKGGSPIDGIYKIGIPSGTATLVGTTGFGVQTVDIAFDANGTLFGLIGTGVTPNELVLIDTLTGGGTKIGPMGFTSGQGIAFHPDVANFAFAYHLFQKWNLMSLPVNVPDKSLNALFPPALVQSRAYGYTGGFALTDTLENRTGYWVKIASAAAHSIIGTPDSTDTIAVQSRWNLIGPNSFIAPVSSISTDPGGILMTGFFAYDDTGYVNADSLIPGRGYWVKTNSAGTLQLNVPSNVPGGTPKATPTDHLAGLSSIRIEDGSGRAQTLYFGARGEGGPSPGQFELPPVPPDAGFDSRFGSGSMVEFHRPDRGPEESFAVRIHSALYPVTIRWDIRGDADAAYALASGDATGAPEWRVPIEGTGSRTLSRDQAADLRLVAGSRAVPTEFALMQNYPNPFNPLTTVGYALPTAERVNLVVYNALGEEVSTVVDARQESGYHTATISAGNLASGVYFYRLTAGSFRAVRKMLLIR